MFCILILQKCDNYFYDNFVKMQNWKLSLQSYLTLSLTALGPSIKELKICKKLQLPDDIVRLIYNIRNFHIWPSLIAISFQIQNPCHNKSTQQEAPQRSDLACREGGMTHRVLSQTRFPKEYFLGCFPIIQMMSSVMYHKQHKWKIKIGNPEGEGGGRLL